MIKDLSLHKNVRWREILFFLDGFFCCINITFIHNQTVLNKYTIYLVLIVVIIIVFVVIVIK